MKEAYINILEMEEFSAAREQLNRLLGSVVSPEMAHSEHGEMEERLKSDGTEFLRAVFQGALDRRASQEVRLESVTGADGVERTHCRTGTARTLMTVFGEVVVTRKAYSQRGTGSLCPLDAELNLPPDKYSHGLRRFDAEEAARVSFDQSVANIARTTGGSVPKLQCDRCLRYPDTTGIRDVLDCHSIRCRGPSESGAVEFLSRHTTESLGRLACRRLSEPSCWCTA